MEKQTTVTTIDAHVGKTLSIGGGNYRIVIAGEQTGGAFAVIEMLVPPNGGPGPHAHAAFHETFYVIEGEVSVKTKGSSYTATTGAYVSIPTGGIAHAFKNESDKMARLLCTVVPAGLEQFFLEIGTPVAPGEFVPPAAPGPEEMKKLQTIAEKYGQQLFPPDYLDQ